MRNRKVVLPPNQADPDLVHRLFFLEQVCLVLLVQMAVLALAAHTFIAMEHALPASLWTMPSPLAVATLLCTVSLFLSESERSKGVHWFSGALACLAAAAACVPLLGSGPTIGSGFPPAIARQSPAAPDSAILLPAFIFLLLAMVIVTLRWKKRLASGFADAMTVLLCLLVLMLASEAILRTLHITAITTARLESPETLVCLALLTLIAVLRRAEHGIFSIFLGFGIGSRIARFLSPAMIVLPLLREISRAHALRAQLIPSQYEVATFSSIATLVLFGLILFLAARINRMQSAINDLTLRDELTGLYNVRGFNLLAEQALHLAWRGKRPFGVLFIDLDNLKQINDRLGHSAGSASLVETAALLNETFREADVIGRLGGDEFVVAGEFSQLAIEMAIDRLYAGAATRSAGTARPFPLSFSVGYAAASKGAHESLKDLISRADKAMYSDKRLKKLAVR